MLLLITVHALSACASATNDSTALDTVSKYSQLAVEKYQTNITYQVNSAKSYVLCYKQAKATALNPTPPLKFFVYDLEHAKILFEDALSNGTIKWLNDHQFQVRTTPGIIKIDEDTNKRLFGYIYDVALQKKVAAPGEKVNYR